MRPAHPQPLRSSARSWWDARRFGLLFHANLASVPAWAPVGQYAEWYRAHVDGEVSDVLMHPSPMAETLAHHRDRWDHVTDYDDFLPLLTFAEFDAEQWTQLAIDAGMSYSVIVAKHHDGLCWWDAPGTNHTVVQAGPRRNVLGEYAEACHRADLAFGTYYSLLDWHDPSYPSRSYVEQVVHPQVLDLVRRYGSRMLWGDGHWGGGGGHWRSDELIAGARRLDPTLIANDRWWADSQEVRSYEYRLPDRIVSEPWELRRGLGMSFGHNRAERDDHLLTPHAVVALLTEVIAKGGHLLLSVGPDAAGRIPEVRSEILRRAGTWVSRHRRLVDEGTPWDAWGDESIRYLVLDDQLHAVDTGGTGRLPSIDRSKGRVLSVVEVLDDGHEQVVAFEQRDHDVQLAKRRHLPPPSGDVQAAVYRIEIEPPPPAPIELFPATTPAVVELASMLVGARPGHIVQLGDGRYIGPARIPPGVTVRGLGPTRTVIDGIESHAVTLAPNARLEHCRLEGGGTRIVWLPKVTVVVSGAGASLLGCEIDGHVEITAPDARIVSCTLIGVVASRTDRVNVTRSTLSGMSWDCAIELDGGAGHLIDGCSFTSVLVAVRLTGTTGVTVRGNQIRARWWGVQAIDTEATVVVGNLVQRTMRAVDIDGGTLAEVTGNVVIDGDSGCVVQRGAASVEIAGNRWERTRVGLLAWDAGLVSHHDNAAVDVADTPVIVGP